MTREEAKQLLPIIQAYAEGGTIQVRINNNDTWTDLLDNKLEISKLFEYRIKPQPEYRPFKTQEECWEEMLKHKPFGWLKSKKTGSVALIGALYTKDEVLMTIWATNEVNSYSSFDVFNDYVFTDCEPFGVNEEYI